MSQSKDDNKTAPTPWPHIALAGSLGGVVLTIHAWLYYPFISDDALISLRYARRFLQGNGLTWNDGEFVEGYSNLLWVLASAALGALGLDLIDAVRILGVVGMTAAVLAPAFAFRKSAANHVFVPVSGSLWIALSGPIAAWAVGGLEQALLAGLLAWTFVLIFPALDCPKARFSNAWGPGLLLGLICLTRADGFVLAGAVIVGVFAALGPSRATFRFVAGLALFPALFIAGQIAFRIAYYDAWLPNTALVKVALGGRSLVDGMRYLARGLLPMTLLIIPAVGGFWCSWKNESSRRRALVLAVTAVGWCGYAATLGGDTQAAHRHLVPVIIVLGFLAAMGTAQILQRFKQPRKVMIAMLLAMVLFFIMQYRADDNRRAQQERWEWNGQVVGNLLTEAFENEQPLLAVTAAGCLPYFSDLPALDMLGLNDRFIATHPPSSEVRRRFKVGHGFGNGRYVLDRKPDLVIFREPGGNREPIYLSGLEMVADPAWQEYYVLVAFEGRKPYPYRSNIWVRKKDGKIGVQRSKDRIRIPGFLFLADSDDSAVLCPKGRIAAQVDAGEQKRYRDVSLPPGRWLWRIDSDGSFLDCTVHAHKADTVEVGDAPGSLFAKPGAAVDLIVRNTSDKPGYLYGALFERKIRDTDEPAAPADQGAAQ